MPLHEHRVDVDFTRIQLRLAYAFDARWEAGIRLPYDIKEQRASVRFSSPMTLAEMDAARRNQEVHHRDATYDGLADWQLLGWLRQRDLVADGDALRVGVGLTLPTGRTERNPYALGNAGLRHRHIQQGTGTVDPLLEIEYGLPIWAELELTVFGWLRASLYENAKDYRGPLELTLGASFALPVTEWVAPHLNYSFVHQGIARWDGDRDVNSGLQVHALRLGATLRLGGGTTVGLDLQLVLEQRTLTGPGQVFEQGPTIMFSIGHRFGTTRSGATGDATGDGA